MKYIVISKPGGNPVPPDQLADAYKASQAYGNKLLEDGTFDCAYAFFEGGGFAIVNADSPDQVYHYLLNYPMFSSFLWDVKPLLDWDKTFESALGIVK